MKSDSILHLIGNTPLVEVRHLDAGCCRLFLKLENQNPGGSIKDRIALSMIEAAERDGRLKPGARIYEATAGNTGLGLALVAGLKGYPITLVIPDKMSREKIAHLRALGAQCILTRSDVEKGHPEYYQDLAEHYARHDPGSFYVNQFNNPDNPAAHEKTTGPEIWADLDHKVDAVVCGVGSGGTVTGLSRFFAACSPSTEMVLADPKGSVLAKYLATKQVGVAGSWLVEGIGEDFVPPICDLSRVSKAYTVTDEESFATARALLAKEGILAGSSSGTLVTAALRYCREQTSPKNVVTFVCDSGNKYLSKMFSDDWMVEQGMLKQQRYGDLRDMVMRRFASGRIVSVGPSDTLNTAWKRMQMYDLSQLPVLVGTKPVGIIDESDLVRVLSQDASAFSQPVKEIMTQTLITLQPNSSLHQVLDLLNQGIAPLLFSGDDFFGLITRSDVINHLRLERNS